MEALSLTVEPAAPADAARTRRKARHRVTKRVAVPPPAPWWQQVLAFLVLVGLVGGAIVVVIKVDQTAADVAAGAVLLLAGIVLVTWASAALRTGLGPKQLLQILKEFFGLIRQSQQGSGGTSDSHSTVQTGGTGQVGTPETG
jgi:hypothetical protein